MDASPSVFIERFAYGIDGRMLGADIDIEAVFDEAQRSPEHDVLEILGV